MEKILSEYINQIVLLVGLTYSLYYNVRSNKDKNNANSLELQTIQNRLNSYEKSAEAYMRTIDKLLDINATFGESIRRVHDKIEEVKDDFVHKDTCKTIREVTKRSYKE